MISLRKYLYADSGLPAEWAEALVRLSSELLQSIRENVLRGDEYRELRNELEAAQEQLGPGLTIEATDAMREAAARILLNYAASVQRKTTNISIEVQQLLGTLNLALAGLAGGSSRSMMRLQQIQESLQRTAGMQDMAALKASLAETMLFIREESHREQQASANELAELEAELKNARELATRRRDSLPGRLEGIRHISEELKEIQPNLAVYVLAYRFDSLPAVVQRYGADAAEEMLFRAIRERVQPLASSAASFRWTSSSLVALFQRSRNLAQLIKEAAALNRAALVYRLPLGNRTAVLTAHPVHLVAEAVMDQPEPLIAEVDEFTGFRM